MSTSTCYGVFDMREISLTQGQVALVDDEDYAALAQFRWSAHKRGKSFYAMRAKPRPEIGSILMHRVITCAGDGLSVDHVDGDGLNNQRHNLRVVSHQQNLCNQRKQNNTSSKFKGVCWRHDTRRWMAYITVKGKRHYLGHFKTEKEAGKTYDAAAQQYHGQFARTNFDA